MFRKQSSYVPLKKSAVAKLKAALLDNPRETGNFRYSRKYLNENLGIKIHRGGILRLEDPETGEPSLWAVVKHKQYSRRFFSRARRRAKGNAAQQKNEWALLLGAPGAFGKVKLIENIATGECKALKVLCKEEDGMEGFLREADFLKQLGRGWGGVIKKKHPNPYKDTKSCIVMDYFPGKDLWEILCKGRLSKLERIEIFLKTLQEVKEMHALELVHADIKPENIIYDEKTGKVRLIDYGLMIKFSESDIKIDGFSLRGTPGYIAPEIIKSQKYSPAGDVFALGRLARELFGFIVTDQFYKKECIGIMDGKAKKAFSKDERLLLISNLILPMEKEEDRISLDEAIEGAKRILASCRKDLGLPADSPRYSRTIMEKPRQNSIAESKEDSCDKKSTQKPFSFWRNPETGSLSVKDLHVKRKETSGSIDREQTAGCSKP